MGKGPTESKMSKLEDALEDFDIDDLPEEDESQLEWWDFDDPAEKVAAVAGDIQFIIESALDARGDALLALPADDDIMPVLEALAEKPIKWKYVTIIPTHDLLVPLDDPRSQVKKLASLFLTRGARVLPLAPEHEDYHMAGAAADARLRDTKWPPDLVLLGMGADGSTAGIAPWWCCSRVRPARRCWKARSNRVLPAWRRSAGYLPIWLCLWISMWRIEGQLPDLIARGCDYRLI